MTFEIGSMTQVGKSRKTFVTEIDNFKWKCLELIAVDENIVQQQWSVRNELFYPRHIRRIGSNVIVDILYTDGAAMRIYYMT